jgi:alkanesulfonate monooxygenase SsuD/methylene tetrahydromethanopterin reductase-like flavin-dependent oxidoreductase (luciferase family)
MRLARFAGVSADALRTRVWIGGAAEIAERIAAFAAAGFDECILALDPPYDATAIAMLERFAAEVLPRFAS